MFEKIRNIRNRRRARFLIRYHKSQRRKRLVQENGNVFYWMLFIEALIAGIVVIITDKTIFGILAFGLCLFLNYLRVKGRLF